MTNKTLGVSGTNLRLPLHDLPQKVQGLTHMYADIATKIAFSMLFGLSSTQIFVSQKTELLENSNVCLCDFISLATPDKWQT